VQPASALFNGEFADLAPVLSHDQTMAPQSGVRQQHVDVGHLLGGQLGGAGRLSTGVKVASFPETLTMNTCLAGCIDSGPTTHRNRG
jgi:hypothetical protein